LARQIVILGEDEVAAGTATVKVFATGQQRSVAQAALATALRSSQP
jgi:histidyl-tRNA synthetase